MKNNTCVSLKEFKNYDYIINYGYYDNNFLVKKNIELYQDYILNYAYLNSNQTNILIDEIMYKYVSNYEFRNFIDINLSKENDDYFDDFKNIFINLYAIYKKISKNNNKKETRWL